MEKTEKPVKHNYVPTKIEKAEEVVEDVAKELNVNLPNNDEPLMIKLIGLFTLVGGLSILGSTFADIFDTNNVNIAVYIMRIITGVVSLGISYGLLKKRRWAIWIYAILVVVGLFLNTFIAILPAIVVIYLFLERESLIPSSFDNWLSRKL